MSDYNDGILPEPCLRMDTHFGCEYESIEFGDGTGYIKAAPILAKVGALHEEIDRLREHVRMPDEPLEIDEKDFYVRAFIKWATEEQPEVKRLEAENAKLRELVRDLWRFTGTACKKYPRLFDQSAQGGQMVMLNMLDSFEQRIRELGVEVDG